MRIEKMALLLLGATSLSLAAGSERIRLNQVGFGTEQRKIAVILDDVASADLVDSATGTSVFQAPLTPRVTWSAAQDTARLFVFSDFKTPGTYYVKAGAESSHPVRIHTNPFEEVAKASIKAFWYNRSSYALPAENAGIWSRVAGHPDTAAQIHASAATAFRPTGTKIRSPGGWYDAGDYGKYIVNSGISTWTLLHLYETAPGYFDSLKLNVPSHPAPTSDLVDEILWNLRWMLTMQDPEDGGVYHKLTTAQFSGMVMPNQDRAVRWIVQKSTAATLDLAAVAATAARVFAQTPELSGLVDSCKAAALAAWGWARKNPTVYYDQTSLNTAFNPDINTGTYGNADVNDEFLWAASELYLLTGLDSFALTHDLAGTISGLGTWKTLGWGDVATLGWIDLLNHSDKLKGSLATSLDPLKKSLNRTVNPIRSFRKSGGYSVPLGAFYWGGNAVFANNSMILFEAWKATSDTSYLNGAVDGLDYLLGRNATGYSFMTGFGSKSSMFPHHRPSEGDGVDAPVPGFLVGGARAGQEDECPNYPSTLGPKSYVDDAACYAVNEVAINWNAPLAFLSGVLSAKTEGHLAPPVSVAPRSRVANAVAWVRSGRTLSATINGKQASSLSLLDARGRSIVRSDRSSMELPETARGLLLLTVTGQAGAISTSKIVLP